MTRASGGLRAGIIIASAIGMSGPAMAQVRSFAEYAKVAGEVGEARSTCRHELDTQALLALGRPFQGQATNPEAAVDILAKALSDASARMRQMGAEAFCAEMLALYGPSGRVAKGLLKP